MKAAEPKTSSFATQQKTNVPFFGKGEHSFFSGRALQEQGTFFGLQRSAYGLSNGTAIQTKLTIGQPNDIYEKEADAMADKVVQRLSNNNPDVKNKTGNTVQTKPAAQVSAIISSLPASIQTKCAACEQEDKLQKTEEVEEKGLMDDKLQKKPIFESNARPPDDDNKNVQRKCAECEKEKKVQKQDDPGSSRAEKPSVESSLSSSKGSGSPLPENTRQEFESSFGANFSDVRIHNDSASAQMSKDLNAHAFTHGSDIYFNAGKYDSNSNSGKHLLAHELTHVVQQNGSKTNIAQAMSGLIQLSWIGDRTEWVRTATETNNWASADPPGAYYVLNGLSMDDMVAILRALSFANRKKLSDNLDEQAGGFDRSRLQLALTNAEAPQSDSAFRELSENLHWAIRSGNFTRPNDGAFYILTAAIGPKQDRLLTAMNRDALDALLDHKNEANEVPGGSGIIAKIEGKRAGAGVTSHEKKLHDMLERGAWADFFREFNGMNETDEIRFVRGASKIDISRIRENISAAAGIADQNRILDLLPPILKSTIKICHRVLKSQNKFHAPEGGGIKIELSTQPPDLKVPNCNSHPFYITLLKDSGHWYSSDSEISTCNSQTGTSNVFTIGNLSEGDYYFNISRDFDNPYCCVEGNIRVTKQDNLKATSSECAGNDASVANMRAEQKFEKAINYAMSGEQLAPEVVARLKELLSPESIGIMVGFAVLFVIMQTNPFGWAADTLLLIGALALAVTVGMTLKEISAIVDHLSAFLKLSANAKSEEDLKKAGHELATAITKIGIDVVLAILLHKAGKAAKPYLKPTSPKAILAGEKITLPEGSKESLTGDAVINNDAIGKDPAADPATSEPKKSNPVAIILKLYLRIADYRKGKNIPAYDVNDGKTGTVAMIDVNGKVEFGENSSLSSSDFALREKGFNLLKSKYPKAKFWSQINFLTHAEAHAILRAWESGMLQKEMTMVVDRPSCNMCLGGLGTLLKILGVEKLIIYSGGSASPDIIVAE